jgi:hypothetical protein
MMLNNLKISDGLRKEVNKKLQSGEVIRLIDQPVAKFFKDDDFDGYFFGSIFVLASFGLPLNTIRLSGKISIGGLIGLFVLFSPFIYTGFSLLFSGILRWRQEKNTVYLITNKRAIHIRGSWLIGIEKYLPRQLKSKCVFTATTVYLPKQLANAKFRKRSDGTGDIIIETRRGTYSDAANRICEYKEEIGFLEIRNIQEFESFLDFGGR